MAAYGCEAFCRPMTHRERTGQTWTVLAFLFLSASVRLTCFEVYFYKRVMTRQEAGFNTFAFACLLFLFSSAVIAGRFYGVLRLKPAKVSIVLLLLLDL